MTRAGDDGARAGDRPSRCPIALLAAAGAGLLVAGAHGAGAAGCCVAGSVLGLALLLPAFRRLTPPGTLRAGRRASRPRCSCAALMTFAFFAADAYIALLLQTWRGTLACADRHRVHGHDHRLDRRDLGAGAADRPLGQPRGSCGSASCCIAVGARADDPGDVAGGAARDRGRHLGPAGSRAWDSCTRRSRSWCCAGRRPEEQGAASSSLQLADILGTALGAGVGGAIAAAGTRAGGDGLGWALAAVYAMSAVVATLGAIGSRRLDGGAEAASPASIGEMAAVD